MYYFQLMWEEFVFPVKDPATVNGKLKTHKQ